MTPARVGIPAAGTSRAGGTDGALTVLPVRGLPEVVAGADLAGLIAGRAELRGGDVVVVSQKVVSKAEGALAWPLPGEDVASARRRVARDGAVRVVVDTPQLLVVETTHGLVCANAGVDASNVPGGALTVLPVDPDASARRLRAGLTAAAGADVGVVIADTFGRPWRVGQTDVAIGVAGLAPLRDDRGGRDRFGTVLEATQVAIADEVAAAADLVRGKAEGVPAVVVRGLAWSPDDDVSVRPLLRDPATDLFRRGRGALADVLGAGAGGDRPADALAAGDLQLAAAAGGRAGHGLVDVAVRWGTPAVVVVTGPARHALEAGAAAATAAAALLDAGFGAVWRPGRPEEDALAVVEVAGVGGPAPGDRGAADGARLR